MFIVSIYKMYPELYDISRNFKERYIIAFVKNNTLNYSFSNTYIDYTWLNFDNIIIALRKSGQIVYERYNITKIIQ